MDHLCYECQHPTNGTTVIKFITNSFAVHERCLRCTMCGEGHREDDHVMTQNITDCWGEKPKDVYLHYQCIGRWNRRISTVSAQLLEFLK